MKKNQKRKIKEEKMKENNDTLYSATVALSGALAWSSTVFSIAWVVVKCIETFGK